MRRWRMPLDEAAPGLFVVPDARSAVLAFSRSANWMRLVCGMDWRLWKLGTLSVRRRSESGLMLRSPGYQQLIREIRFQEFSPTMKRPRRDSRNLRTMNRVPCSTQQTGPANCTGHARLLAGRLGRQYGPRMGWEFVNFAFTELVTRKLQSARWKLIAMIWHRGSWVKCRMPALLRSGPSLLLPWLIDAPTRTVTADGRGRPSLHDLQFARCLLGDLGVLAAQIPQNLFCRPYSSILGLFENRKTAQIGICEQQ